jgi:hypothetical protein
MAVLTDSDIKRPSQREYATALEDTDVFVVEDVSEQKIKPITKLNTKEALGINAKEESSNKKSTLAENSETYYPNQKAVNDGLATKTSKSQIAYDNDTTSFIANTLASGAIIERGSNANGEFIQFADGTMIQLCEKNTTVSSAADQGTNIVTETITYPKTFSPANSVIVAAGDVMYFPNTYYWTNARTPNASSLSFELFTSAPITEQAVTFRFFVIGRWK